MARFFRSSFSLENFRQQLANVDALPQLCVLGLVSGVITGALMVGFRLLLETGAALYMPENNPEAFEALSPWLRALLPMLAVALVGVFLYRQKVAARKLGVGHVIERLTYHQGRFPLRNWLNQWWVGVVSVLLALVAIKLVLTSLTVAGGIPIGIIGPVLVIGAAMGTLCGLVGAWLWPDKAADPGIFAMLGMAAMMGAVLQAPLAALMALLELTHTPNIMLPGMLAVVVACLTSRHLTGCEGFFISSLRYGLHPLQQPLMQALSRVSVPAMMERSVVRTERMITAEEARKLLETNLVWLIIERSTQEKPVLALKAAELARWLMERDASEGAANDPQEIIDLVEIPGQRLELAPIALQATLSEAFIKLQNNALGALYVVHGYRPRQRRISGIITRGAIERYYHYTDPRLTDGQDAKKP